MTWILVIALYAHGWSAMDGIGVTSIPGFQSKESCEGAGAISYRLVRNRSGTSFSFVCIPQQEIRLP